MSTNPETPAETDDQNLDDFSADFFGQKKAEPEQTNSEVEEEADNSSDALNDEDQDTQTDDDNLEEDTSEEDEVEETTEDEDTEEDEAEEEQKPKKKSRFQERIDELTAKAREAERREQEARDRIAALEAKLNNPDENAEPKPQTPEAKGDAPTPPKPDDLNEDGTEKYPLGEYDPAFQDALIEFKLEQRLQAAESKRLEREREQQLMQARAQVEEQWNGQLDDARQRYDDFDDRLTTLTEMTVEVDPAYGEYLADTIMSMEKGADVLYYLSQNPDEVTKIVNSGARNATIALGRIEAQFGGSSEKPTKSVRTSKAPPPPPANKGAAIARGTVAPDTDDLDAFSQLLFNKK